MAVSNLTRLAKARLLSPKQLTDVHKARLEKLSRAEVTTLIRIKKKLRFSGKLHRKSGKAEPFTFI